MERGTFLIGVVLLFPLVFPPVQHLIHTPSHLLLLPL